MYGATNIFSNIFSDENCPAANNMFNITKADSVFTLEIIILVFAAINFVTSVTLISGNSIFYILSQWCIVDHVSGYGLKIFC